MKKLFTLVMCLCVVLSLTAPAWAADYSDVLPDWLFDPSDYLQDDYTPPPNDYGVDPENFWEIGDVGIYFNLPAYQRAIADAKAAQDAAESPPAQDTSSESVDSTSTEGNGNDESDTNISDVPVVPSKYPTGSYIDDSGNVWSADGELLSPGTTPAQPADDGNPSSDAMPADPDSSVADPSELNPPVYVLNDMRAGSGDGVFALAGLKALIVSIFGEYTPITTTAAITETVGSETTTTLIDVVADGAAGVDYEWCAGVLLFAIMLFCLMKIIGGVMK